MNVNLSRVLIKEQRDRKKRKNKENNNNLKNSCLLSRVNTKSWVFAQKKVFL